MKWFLITVVAVVFVGSAQAAPRPSPIIQGIADSFRGVGHPVTCEDDESQWATSHPAPAPYYIFGATHSLSREIQLSPRVCRPLEARQRTADAHMAMLVLMHEMMHSVGVFNEADAECLALGQYFQFARQYFGYDAHSALQAYQYAWDWHESAAPAYKPTWCRRQHWQDLVEPDPPPQIRTVVKRQCYVRNVKTRRLTRITCPPIIRRDP